MKYAKIENGVVAQVQPNKDTGFVQVQDDVVCGMIDNSDGTFSKPEKNIDSLKQKALSKALDAFNEACDVITQNAPSKEIDSWKKQEDEARAWNADNTAPTPLIDGLLVSRGLSETKAQLVQKIIDNADLWAVAYSAELGVYQSRVKRINATTATLADVQAVIDEMVALA